MKKFIYWTVVVWAMVGGILNVCGAGVGSVRATGDVGVSVVDDVSDVGDGVMSSNAGAERKPVFIKAINPGYTVDGKSNVGEMIEIAIEGGQRDEWKELASYSFSYTNSSGKTTVLVELPMHIKVASENLVLRLASAPEAAEANFNYKTTLAMGSGRVSVTLGDEMVDEVCWGKKGCAGGFSSASPTILVRNDVTGEMEHRVEYTPNYNPDAVKIEAMEDVAVDVETGVSDESGRGGGVGHCAGVEFSEVLSYYAETQSEQFIELHNRNSEQVLLNGCRLRYKNKEYGLDGIMQADAYMARYLSDFAITKNPASSNMIELLDEDGAILDKMTYPNGQIKGASYAMIGYDAVGEEIWKVTYAVTPGEANVYQEYKTCEAGKVINEATGNCVKVTSVTEKICEEGQYLNPLTGRCKKIEVATVTECKEGYELNPETKRCRKITNNTGATYEIKNEEYKEENAFVAVYAVAGVAAVAIIYIIYEFRRDIVKIFRKVFRRFH